MLSTLAACDRSDGGSDAEEAEPSEVDTYYHNFEFSRYVDHKYNVVCYVTDEALRCFSLDNLNQMD
jgi:hypothetical protein